MTAFDPTRMRFPTKSRKPFRGTLVEITGTSKNGCKGIVVEDNSNKIAVKIGGVIFYFYTHQVIEILA